MKGIQQLLVWRSDVVLTAVVAMTGALVLALPIAHVYRLVKHRHEYDPAVTETILLLPAVVAGIVIVGQGSLALSVSLVGVAGAVRFRSNLKDTNDAMFIFFAIALGIAAGVQGLDLAFAMCVVFYATVFAVSRIRLSASHRAHEGRSDSASPSDAPDRARSADDRQRLLDTESTDEPPESRERVIALRVVHVGAADGPRPAVEARLEKEVKRWKLAEVVAGQHGESRLEYRVRLKKKIDPRTLLDSLTEAARPYGASVEYVDGNGAGTS